MRIRHADISVDEWESPKGRFGSIGRTHTSSEETECPFELEHIILKPGKRNHRFHSHGTMWELYYVLSGTASMRTDEETVDLQVGDSYLCRPGLAHQIINDSDEDFVYLVIANNPPFDAVYYPDSGKLAVWENLWGPMPEGRYWYPKEGVERFTDEE